MMSVHKITHPYPSASLSAAPTFLIAHPQEAMRRLLRQALKEAGYERSFSVETGPQAIEELRLNDKVLIVGLDLVGLDCWQVLRMIRSGAFCSPDLPVIVTGDARLIAAAEPMVREGGAYLLAEDALEALSQTVARCLSGPQKTPVLLVEDNRKTARMVGHRLRDRFEVEIALTGEAGLRAWRDRRHPLVLLDLVLPDIRGETVLRHILNDDPSQLVVAVTALDGQTTHRALMEAGAVGFLLKPIDLLELPYYCEQLLRGYAAYRRGRAGVERRCLIDRFVMARASAASRLLKSGRPGLAEDEVNRILAAQIAAGAETLADDDRLGLLDRIEGATPSEDRPFDGGARP